MAHMHATRSMRARASSVHGRHRCQTGTSSLRVVGREVEVYSVAYTGWHNASYTIGRKKETGMLERERESSRVLVIYTIYSASMLPCLEVAEFLGDDLADVDAKPVDDALGKVRVRGAAEDLNVGHSAL